MAETGEKLAALFAGQVIVNRVLRDRRTDDVGQSRAEEHFAADARSQMHRVHIPQLGEPFVRAAAVRVEPAGVIAQTFVGDFIRAQLENLLKIAQKGIENRGLAGQIGIERRAGNAEPRALRRAVDVDAPLIDVFHLPNDAAQDADVLIQPNVIHVLRLAVQPRNQMAGNCRAEEAADILAFAALTGAVHRQQSVTHARERGLFQPAAACAGITVELQHKRERLIAFRTQIFGVNARAAHAREPQIEVFTGRIGRNFGWFDGVAQRHCVGFRHARVPERVKIGGARGRAAIRGIGHRGTPPHSK